MQITKSFDVKINIVYPYLTKNISAKDSERISRNTLFKYTPQQAIEVTQAVSQPLKVEEESQIDIVTKVAKRFKDLFDGFSALKEQAEKSLEGIVYNYDSSRIENEALSNAEEGIFGTVSEKITFKKFKQAIELREKIDEEIQRRAIVQGARNVA